MGEINKYLETSAKAQQYQLSFVSYFAAKSPKRSFYLSMGMRKNNEFLGRWFHPPEPAGKHWNSMEYGSSISDWKISKVFRWPPPISDRKVLEVRRKLLENFRDFPIWNTASMFHWILVISCRNRPVLLGLDF